MGGNDVRINCGYFNHFKIKKLESRLGPEGVLSHLKLLAFTAENKPKGKLTNMEEEDILLAAGWRNADGDFINTLLDLRLLIKRKRYHEIHDWKEHQPFVYNRPERVKQARKAARASWDSPKRKNTPKSEFIDGADRITDSITDSKAERNAPSDQIRSESDQNQGEKEISQEDSDVIKLFQFFMGITNLNGLTPTEAENRVLIAALKDRSLNDWRPWVKKMNQMVNDDEAKRPSLKFYFEIDYSKFSPDRDNKVKLLCPRCPDDKGVMAEPDFYSVCKCGKRRVVKK